MKSSCAASGIHGISPAVLNALLGLLDGALMVTFSDTQGILQFANDTFCKRCGYSRDELLGANPRLFRSGLHSDEFYDEIWKTVRSGRIWHGEVSNKSRQGELYWTSTNIAPVFNDGGEISHFLCLMVDATEHHIAQEQLKEKSRLAVLGQFADGIAHDLNNFLTLGKYAVDETPELPLRNRVLLESALSGMTGLTSRLRSFASGQTCQYHEFNLESMANYVIQMISLKACYAASMHITMDLSGLKGALVRGNEGEIASIVINLLINACEALEGRPSPRIQVCGRLQRGRVELSVSDNGPGIPKHLINSLFQYKSSTKGANRGSGLHAAHRIAQSHGGELRLERPGPGALFVLSLPVV